MTLFVYTNVVYIVVVCQGGVYYGVRWSAALIRPLYHRNWSTACKQAHDLGGPGIVTSSDWARGHV